MSKLKTGQNPVITRKSDSIVELIDGVSEVMQSKKLGRIMVKTGDIELTIEASNGGPYMTSIMPTQSAIMPVDSHSNPQILPTTSTIPDNSKILLSNTIGTVYLAANPKSPPFIKVGDKIVVGQVLMIIEVMKVMNEFKSDKMGVVKQVLVQNEERIEYGQHLVILE